MRTNYTFTVFTCTYNRAATLHRVYESLAAQTFADFEWIVFDNGSQDNTKELIERWAKESDFCIRYLSWPENTGYQNTFNECISVARGNFFLILDSDDRCVPHALERFYHLWNRIPAADKVSFSGITVLCEDQNGNLAGNRFPEDYLISNALELEYRYKVRGEKWGFVRIDILRKYPFPKVKHHVMPHVVWHQIARRYKTLFANEILRIYYSDEQQKVGQLTAVSPEYNATGKLIGQQAIINNNMDWFFTAPWALSKACIQYIRFSLHADRGVIMQYRELNNGYARLLYLTLLPIGIVLYIKDKTGNLLGSAATTNKDKKVECGSAVE